MPVALRAPSSISGSFDASATVANWLARSRATPSSPRAGSVHVGRPDTGPASSQAGGRRSAVGRAGVARPGGAGGRGAGGAPPWEVTHRLAVGGGGSWIGSAGGERSWYPVYVVGWF